MNRRLLWLAVVCLFIFAAGCASKETANQSDNIIAPAETKKENEEQKTSEVKDSNSSPGNNERPDSKAQGNKEDKDSEKDRNKNTGTEKIKKMTELDGDRTIHYPQFNMRDKGNEQQINDKIYSEVTAYASQFDGPLEIDYEVKLYTMDILSILYKVESSGGAYPSEHVFTTSIDVKTGENIRLTDLVEINEEFVQKLKNSPYLDSENPASPNNEKKAAVLDYIDSVDVEELLNALQHADEIYPETNSYNIYSYVQGNHVIVSIGIPHALGDHAEFKVSLE